MDELLKKLGIEDTSAALRVKTSLDFTKVALSPEEGFLLSRIDVTQSIAEILQVSTFSREVTVQMLMKFVEQDFLDVKLAAPKPKRPTPAPIPPAPRVDAPAARTPRAPYGDLEVQICLEIEDLYDRLQKKSQTPAQILGISATASAAEAKKAYMQKTKKFHPDRLFRKEAGIYRTWMEFIFLEVTKAHQQLTGEIPTPEAAPKKPNPLADRIRKGRQFLEDARAIMAKDPQSALTTLKLAVSFDPQNPEIKKLIADLEPRLGLQKAAPAFQKAQDLEKVMAYGDAADAYEKAANGDPQNELFQRSCGEFLLYKYKQPNRALPYARRTVALNAKAIDNLLLLGFNLKALEQYTESLSVFEKVLNLDNSNLFAKNEIADIKKNLIISGKKR